MHRKKAEYKILLPIMPEIIMVTITVNRTVTVIIITIATEIREILWQPISYKLYQKDYLLVLHAYRRKRYEHPLKHL
jgi:hypothetical protein